MHLKSSHLDVVRGIGNSSFQYWKGVGSVPICSNSFSKARWLLFLSVSQYKEKNLTKCIHSYIDINCFAMHLLLKR